MKIDYDFKFDSVNPNKIEGMGKDVETVTNEAGGKQSNIPYAFHLIDPEFLLSMTELCTFFEDKKEHIVCTTIKLIKDYMVSLDKSMLISAVFNCRSTLYGLFDIAKVLKEGADKYEPNNWRLIPAESHLSHAIAHLLAYANGDEQDNHLSHAMCRLMMAYATKESEGFVYTKYVPKDSSEHLPCYCK